MARPLQRQEPPAMHRPSFRTDPLARTTLVLLGLALGLVVLSQACVPVQAQTLDATATYGRVFNLATDEWTLAVVPGVEFGVGEDTSRFGGFTFNVSWWLDASRQPRLPEDTLGTSRSRYFEQDWSASWIKQWTNRFSTTTTGAIYILHELGTDKIWMIETRYRLFGR